MGLLPVDRRTMMKVTYLRYGDLLEHDNGRRREISKLEQTAQAYVR